MKYAWAWAVMHAESQTASNNNKMDIYICLIITTHLASIVLCLDTRNVCRKKNQLSSSSHTHIQRRNGKRTIAAPDVGHFKNRLVRPQPKVIFRAFPASVSSSLLMPRFDTPIAIVAFEERAFDYILHASRLGCEIVMLRLSRISPTLSSTIRFLHAK